MIQHSLDTWQYFPEFLGICPCTSFKNQQADRQQFIIDGIRQMPESTYQWTPEYFVNLAKMRQFHIYFPLIVQHYGKAIRSYMRGSAPDPMLISKIRNLPLFPRHHVNHRVCFLNTKSSKANPSSTTVVFLIL